MLFLVAAPALAQDLLVLHDGSRRTGQLQACVGGQCRLDGQAIDRAEIAWIGLGEQGTPPTPTDPARDEVWLRDERVQPGPLLGISLGVVATEASSIDRAEVRWVYLGSTAGVPPLPSSEAARAPPVPPAPPEGPGAAALPAIPPLADSGPAPSGARIPAPPPAATPQPAATLLLNEVRFLPGEGESQFVEISNASAERIALDGVSLRNEKGKTFELPPGLPVEPGGFLLVLFDGETSGEPGVVHAPTTAFLGETGALWLQTEEGLADGVTWSLPSLSSVDLCRGGRCSPPPPGSVIARLPGVVRPMTPQVWAPLDPELATPGAPNPRPPVSAFAGIPGMIFAGKPRFSWYSVLGAAGYRLQVAREEAFSIVVHETSVDGAGNDRLEQVTVHGPELARGDYFWRVQALGAGGEDAEFSRPMPFSVDPSRNASAPPRTASRRPPGGSHGSRAQAQGDGTETAEPSEPPAPGDVRRELAVPIIRHQKDTRMLTLEAPNESPPMSWDTPDTAGYPYCVRAGVAMISDYYHTKLGLPGRLSQDRIAYEAFQGLQEHGPEYDLPVVGMDDWRTTRYVLPHAFGTSGEYRANPHRHGRAGGGSDDFRACMDYAEAQVLEECARRGWAPRSEECLRYRTDAESDVPCPPEIAWSWGVQAMATIRQEIDAGRPLIATTPSHLFLIIGYAQEGEQFILGYQDGGGREDVQANAAGLQNFLDSYWTGLAPVNVRSDEPELLDETDSDDDEVLDFDETERFGTDPDKPDSDDDGVNDKEEIRYSVWDPDHGYHNAVTSLESTASDDAVVAAAASAIREPMELMPDSDDGGCQDGEEDLNGDGIRDPGETSNFVPPDDPTVEPGECGEQWTGTSQTRIWSREAGEWFENDVTAEIRWREVSRQPIIDPGPEHGGREAGKRVGTWSEFTCAGTTFNATWRAFSGPGSGHTGSDGSCTQSGSGGATVVDAEPRIDGIIVRKHVDWDLTPVLGFDLPPGGGLYSVSCGRDGPSFPVETSCSWGVTVSETAGFSQLGFGLGIPGTTPRCHHDPEVRYLEGGGNQMTGSYSVFDPSSECVPQGAAMSWSLCKVGTPCAPLPPLPTGAGVPEPAGEGAQPPS